MRVLLLALLLSLLAGSSAQSLWLESGVAYTETSSQTYEPAFKLGIRAIVLVTETVGAYLHPHIRAGFGLDAGLWLRFPAGIEDLEGFRSYLGGGLSIIQGRFGVGLSAAFSYETSANTEVALVYTHRALLTPELGQAFDIALAFVLRFD